MSKIIINPIDTKPADDQQANAAEIERRANAMVIKTQMDLEAAASYVGGIKTYFKKLVTLRKGMTDPLDEARKKTMDLFRPIIAVIESAERKIKQQMVDYGVTQRRIQAEQQRKLDADTEKKRVAAQEKADAARAAGDEKKAARFEEKAEAVPPATVIADRVEKVAGLAMRKDWKYDIIDDSLIPKKYWVLDEKMIARAVKNEKDKCDIHGIRVYSIDVPAIGSR